MAVCSVSMGEGWRRERKEGRKERSVRVREGGKRKNVWDDDKARTELPIHKILEDIFVKKNGFPWK